MENLSEDLIGLVDAAASIFVELPPDYWNDRIAADKWSKKEILGHLIDSAANNHHRIVRAQFEFNPIITYDQEYWVTIQDYFKAPIKNLINLWISYNKHLAYLISILPTEKMNNFCDIRKVEPVTLEFVIKEYIKHLKHHLDQIIKSDSALIRK